MCYPQLHGDCGLMRRIYGPSERIQDNFNVLVSIVIVNGVFRQAHGFGRSRSLFACSNRETTLQCCNVYRWLVLFFGVSMCCLTGK